MQEIPEDYVIGSKPFLGCTIYLDSKPLIPRNETEWWAERAIEKIKTRTSLRVLDMFAGSGCIGVSVLKHIPHAHVDFGELEERHIATITKNVLMNGIDPGRANYRVSDVWNNIPDTYDVVLANPPYLAHTRIGRVQESVLDHEPHEALFAADDGFLLIKRMVQELPQHLTKGGEAWVEHEPEHQAPIAHLSTELGLVAESYTDQYGVIRYSVILNP